MNRSYQKHLLVLINQRLNSSQFQPLSVPYRSRKRQKSSQKLSKFLNRQLNPSLRLNKRSKSTRNRLSLSACKIKISPEQQMEGFQRQWCAGVHCKVSKSSNLCSSRLLCRMRKQKLMLQNTKVRMIVMKTLMMTNDQAGNDLTVLKEAI